MNRDAERGNEALQRWVTHWLSTTTSCLNTHYAMPETGQHDIVFNSKETKPVWYPAWEICSWQRQKDASKFQKVKKKKSLMVNPHYSVENKSNVQVAPECVSGSDLCSLPHPGPHRHPRLTVAPCLWEGSRKDMTISAPWRVKQPDWTLLLIEGPSRLAGPPGYLLHLFMTTAPRSEINSWWVQTGAQLVLLSPPK